MTPMERFNRDPMFRTIVHQLYGLLEQAQMTPTEVREAAMVAQILYEEKHVRPTILVDIRRVPFSELMGGIEPT